MYITGTFVKAVMRVVSYIEVLKEVVLGLGFYEVSLSLSLSSLSLILSLSLS